MLKTQTKISNKTPTPICPPSPPSPLPHPHPHPHPYTRGKWLITTTHMKPPGQPATRPSSVSVHTPVATPIPTPISSVSAHLSKGGWVRVNTDPQVKRKSHIVLPTRQVVRAILASGNRSTVPAHRGETGHRGLDSLEIMNVQCDVRYIASMHFNWNLKKKKKKLVCCHTLQQSNVIVYKAV